MVFKCRWPSKFGAHGLLAIKMLRDPHGFQASSMVEAFKYEADVLARCRCGAEGSLQAQGRRGSQAHLRLGGQRASRTEQEMQRWKP